MTAETKGKQAFAIGVIASSYSLSSHKESQKVIVNDFLKQEESGMFHFQIKSILVWKLLPINISDVIFGYW